MESTLPSPVPSKPVRTTTTTNSSTRSSWWHWWTQNTSSHGWTSAAWDRQAMCLHNMIIFRKPRQQNVEVDRKDEDHRIIPVTWRNDLVRLLPVRGQFRQGRETEVAKNQRDYLKAYYWSPVGSVPWQMDKIWTQFVLFFVILFTTITFFTYLCLWMNVMFFQGYCKYTGINNKMYF